MVVLGLGLSGCAHVSEPKMLTHNLPPPPESFVFVPVEIPVSTVKEALEAKGKSKPVASGKTDEVNGTVAVTFLAKQIRVKHVVQAANKSQGLKRGLLAAASGGMSEVARHVPGQEQVLTIIDKGQKITGEVVDRFTGPVTESVEAKYVLHYTGKLARIESLYVKKDKLYVSALFDWDIRADLVGPLPVNYTVKSALTTKGLTAAKVVATLTTGEDGKLKIELDKGGTKVEVRSLDLPGLGLDLTKLIPYDVTAAATELAVSQAFAVLPVHKWAQKGVNKSDDARTFGKRIRAALKKQGCPITLGTNLFLDMAPSVLAFGNPAGIERNGTNLLVLPVELTTPVRLVFSKNEFAPFNLTNSDELRITTTTQSRRLVDMQLVTDISTDEITRLIDKELEKFWQANNYLTLGYEFGPTAIWESDGRKIVVRLPIRKKGSSRNLVVLHAWANLRIVEQQRSGKKGDKVLKEARIENIDWNAQSKHLFVRSFAWLAHEPLRKAIQEAGKFSLEEVERGIEANRSQTYENGVLKVGFTLNTHEFQDLTIADGFVRIALHVTGEPLVSFK